MLQQQVDRIWSQVHFIWPELTTIQQPIARMAAEAVDMLVAGVWGSKRSAERLHRLIPHALVARESAAAPRLASGWGSAHT